VNAATLFRITGSGFIALRERPNSASSKHHAISGWSCATISRSTSHRVAKTCSLRRSHAVPICLTLVGHRITADSALSRFVTYSFTRLPCGPHYRRITNWSFALEAAMPTRATQDHPYTLFDVLIDEVLDRSIPSRTSSFCETWSRAMLRAINAGGDGLSSEQVPLELRPSPPRKHLAIGAALAAAVAFAITLAEAADSYLWIAIGSALGGMARHWCNAVATEWLGTSFPWGTLFINITGSLIIGFFFALTDPTGRFDVSASARLFVTTGICGGYTTFSAFSLQSLTLFQQGAWFRGSGYVAASIGLCLLAVWAGYALGAAICWAFR